MTRPTPREPAHDRAEKRRRRRERETGRSMRSKVQVSRRRGPCGGGRSGGTLAKAEERMRRGSERGVGLGGGEEGVEEEEGSTVEIWSWRAGRLGRGIGGNLEERSER
ncbi:hypothetical protein Scep_024382 [Stephania cephalantha]|uniref:Uncharacterized protein n=1 Tax=Stephania cephalantha TaxID=152367 RepID=A0AAP0F1X1_9MAGN